MNYKEKIKVTPATAVTTLDDIREEGNRSVWYNSRYYRPNLYRESDGFCFRDIHIFDETMKSRYLDTPGIGNQFFYYTLPFIDRFYWSTPDDEVGLRLVKFNENGTSSSVV